MGQGEKRAVFVESRVLSELHSGSYEELLTMVDQAMVESGKFGTGNASLLATYADRIVAVTEDGEFYSANYAVRDGVVSLAAVRLMQVDVISESDAALSGVDSFYEGGSLLGAMRGLMSMHEEKGKTPLIRLQERLDRLFSGGKVWKRKVDENRQEISEYAWDANYGKIDHTFYPMFDGLADASEASAEEIVSSVLKLKGKLSTMLAQVKEAYEVQRERTDGLRDQESDQVLTGYDFFATDYIQYLEDVLGFVSRAIEEANEGGCILCTAKVHDEVSVRLQDLDLAGRFVRKVASGFIK